MHLEADSDCLFVTPPSRGVPSTVISMSGCLSVCPLAQLENHTDELYQQMFVYDAYCRGSSDGVAIRYVLPVL